MIFALDKEDLLQLLPTKTKFGQKISDLVQQYYYLLLMMILGLLVMSDPYLGGYGSLVWYMFWYSLFTLIVLFVLFISHRFIRQYTEILFFQEDEMSGGSTERFENAKSWYGFYVVILFLFFLLIASVICANIWGYGLTFQTLKESLYYELPFKINPGGTTVSLKVIDLLRLSCQ